jgi:RNA polymerase-binding transcription factor
VAANDLEAPRVELQRRRRALLETVRRAGAELEALRSAERDPEFEEGAQAEHEVFTLARLGESQRRELQLIDAALARIDAGEYGVCRDCEQEIDPRRLAALPYAVLCTECADRRERAAPALELQQPPTL